ncbi:hypothetical protein Tco_0969733 [Tanacetum coccineum]
MVDEELDQLLEGAKNVDVNAFVKDVLNSQEDLEVAEGSAGDEFELRRREKGKGIEETRDIVIHSRKDDPLAQDAHSSVDKEKLQELTVTDPTPSSSSPSSSSPKPKTGSEQVNEIAKNTVPLYVAEGLLLDKQKSQADVAAMVVEVDLFLKNYMTNNILHVHPTHAPTSSAQDLQYQMMKNDEKLQRDDLSIWWSLKIKFDKSVPSATPCRTAAICPKDHDDHHNNAQPEGENSVKRRKTSKHRTYSIGESSSEQAMDQESNPSGLGTQEQLDEFDARIDGFGTDDDEVPNEEVRRASVSCRSDAELLKERHCLGKQEGKVIDLIIEPHNQYLNKNDTEDLYLLCVNGKVDNYREWLLRSLTVFIRSTVIRERVQNFQLGMESYQQKVNLTTPTIIFPSIKEYELFTITSKLVVRMIYENSKKEKRVTIHKEIHKFCDAMLKRVLEKLKKYNKDVKYAYVDPSPSYVDVEYLRFYKEDLKDRLKH